jgi:hypothetical protein
MVASTTLLQHASFGAAGMVTQHEQQANRRTSQAAGTVRARL